MFFREETFFFFVLCLSPFFFVSLSLFFFFFFFFFSIMASFSRPENSGPPQLFYNKTEAAKYEVWIRDKKEKDR